MSGAEFTVRDRDEEGGILKTVADWMGAHELTETMIQKVSAKAWINDRQLRAREVVLVTDAFAGFIGGELTLREPVETTELPSVPVRLYLKISLARDLNLLAREPPEGATHVLKPDFLTLQGAIGSPRADVGTLDLLSAVMEQFGEKLLGADETQYLYGTTKRQPSGIVNRDGAQGGACAPRVGADKARTPRMCRERRL